MLFRSAMGVVNSKKPPVFVSTIPVTIDVAGGITSDQIMAKFQSLLSRPDVIKDLHSADVGFVGGKPPYKLINKPGEVALEVSALSEDLSGEKALRAVKALTELSQRLNKTQSDASSEVASAKKPTSDLEDKFKQVVASQIAEEAPFRVQLFADRKSTRLNSSHSSVSRMPSSA